MERRTVTLDDGEAALVRSVLAHAAALTKAKKARLGPNARAAQDVMAHRLAEVADKFAAPVTTVA